MHCYVYHREHCHLCDQALELIAASGLDLQLELVDIDQDLELGLRYGLRIPVLRAANGRELDWPFDEAALRRFFE